MHDSDKTIAALFDALQFSPGNVRLRKHLAELLMQAERYEEAIGQWQEVFRQTEDPECQIHLGKAYFARSNFQAARDVLLQALSSTPSSDISLLFSRSCFALGEYQQAGDAYQEALDKDPELRDEAYERELAAKGVKIRLRLMTDDSGDDLAVGVPGDVLERPKITFKQVGGLEELKEQIRMNIIYPFQNPALFKSLNSMVLTPTMKQSWSLAQRTVPGLLTPRCVVRAVLIVCSSCLLPI